MAAGKVITGYSKPYVALYNNNGGTVTYTKQQVLARGVKVDIQLADTEENAFYADNVVAETEPGVFTKGTVTLTVDGLLDEARQFVLGLPDPILLSDGSDIKVYGEGDQASPPYVGVGFIMRYQSDGVVTYKPTVIRKVRFKTPNTGAETQGEQITWQTEELTGNISRDDTSKHEWKIFASDQETEEEAENVLKIMLGGTATPPAA